MLYMEKVTLLVFLNDKKIEKIVTKDAIEMYLPLDYFLILHEILKQSLRNKL